MEEYISRYIETSVLDHVKRKMVFVGGPLQSGKTTLAKSLGRQRGYDVESWYLSWDSAEDREKIITEQFPAGSGILILDEIHKYSGWGQALKGLQEKRVDELHILVTGSARLDHYLYGGDYLQGRYHFYRLFPFTWAELGAPSISTVKDLLIYGGFPEQFLSQSEKQTKRLSSEYRLRIIEGNLSKLENVNDLGLIEKMVIRLPDLVGAPLSLNAIRADLQVSHQSVSRWLTMLENLYLIFRIYPFGAPKLRAVKKEAKHYHLDWTVIPEERYRFENLIACHLLKWCFFLQDTEGRNIELRYFRDVDKREVDFVITEDDKPVHFIEATLSGKDCSASLRYLKKHFPLVPATQIILDQDVDVATKDGIRICSAHFFLKDLI